jgi:hypothetical protein
MTYAFERVVSQVRLRYLLAVVSGIYWGTEARLREDDDGGEFLIHDGSGNHDVIVWSEHGLVAGSFDHDNHRPDDCFPRAPESLASLVERVRELTRGEITGGLWVTRGEGAQACMEGEGTSEFPGYAMTVDGALNGGAAMSQGWAELASLGPEHLAVVEALHARAESGPCELTDKEAAVLGRSPEGDEVEPGAVEVAKKRLGRFRAGVAP